MNNNDFDDEGYAKEFKTLYQKSLDDPNPNKIEYVKKLQDILRKWVLKTDANDANCVFAAIILNSQAGDSALDKHYYKAINMPPYDSSVYQWYRNQVEAILRAKDYRSNKVPKMSCDELILEFKEAYYNGLNGDNQTMAYVDAQMGVLLTAWEEKCPHDSNLMLAKIIWDNLFGYSTSDHLFDSAVSEASPTNKEEFEWFKNTAEEMMNSQNK